MIVERPELRVYDPYVDRNNIMIPKGAVEMYTSLRWGNAYNEAAEFEIHFPLRKEIVTMFDVFDIVQIMRPVREQYGIVLYTNIEIRETGEKEFIVKGRMISYVLKFRFSWYNIENATGTGTMQHTTIDDTAPRIIRFLLRECINDHSTTLGRTTYLFGQEKLYVGTQVTGSYDEKTYEYQRTKSVYDAVCELAAGDELGFYMTLEDSVPGFYIYDYNNANVYFDLELGNIRAMNYTKSIDNYVSTVAIESANSYIDVWSGGGSDVRNVMQYMSTELSSGSTTMERLYYARQQIMLNKPVDGISAEIIQNNRLYLRDYNIGDLIIVRIPELDATKTLPILGAEEVWENGYNFSLQLGEQIMNPYKKLRYEVKTK